MIPILKFAVKISEKIAYNYLVISILSALNLFLN